MDLPGAINAMVARIMAATDRPVLRDPRHTGNAPCVLVEPPRVYPEGTQCGTLLARWVIVVIGIPGGFTELGPLAHLVDQVLGALDEYWTACEPVVYYPLTVPAGGDPSQAFKITAETYIDNQGGP